jgi:hypothetical protein
MEVTGLVDALSDPNIIHEGMVVDLNMQPVAREIRGDEWTGGIDPSISVNTDEFIM